LVVNYQIFIKLMLMVLILSSRSVVPRDVLSKHKRAWLFRIRLFLYTRYYCL